MTKKELVNELETLRKSIASDLTYVNAKHDVLVNLLCSLNNILSEADKNDPV